jgi:putative ABC transport system permease protein
VAAIINQSGMTYVPPGRAAPVPLQVWILASPPLVIGTMIGLFLTAVVSAWAPARRAARMDVVTALRHV